MCVWGGNNNCVYCNYRHATFFFSLATLTSVFRSKPIKNVVFSFCGMRFSPVPKVPSSFNDYLLVIPVVTALLCSQCALLLQLKRRYLFFPHFFSTEHLRSRPCELQITFLLFRHKINSSAKSFKIHELVIFLTRAVVTGRFWTWCQAHFIRCLYSYRYYYF